MGLLSKVKGFLNIGGVKVELTKVEDPFPIGDTCMKGRFTLTSKSDKTILGYRAKFICEETIKDGEEEKRNVSTLGTDDSKRYLINDQFPFEIAEGEVKELSFMMTNVNQDGFTGAMAEKGGALGTLGKAALLAGKMKQKGTCRYFVEVTVDVEGTPLDPSDKVEVSIVAGKS